MMCTVVGCPKCEGYGYPLDNEDEDCDLCGGSGTVTSDTEDKYLKALADGEP